MDLVMKNIIFRVVQEMLAFMQKLEQIYWGIFKVSITENSKKTKHINRKGY